MSFFWAGGRAPLGVNRSKKIMDGRMSRSSCCDLLTNIVLTLSISMPPVTISRASSFGSWLAARWVGSSNVTTLHCAACLRRYWVDLSYLEPYSVHLMRHEHVMLLLFGLHGDRFYRSRTLSGLMTTTDLSLILTPIGVVCSLKIPNPLNEMIVNRIRLTGA